MDYRLKAAFIGFGEVNTPFEIISAKCAAAKEELLNTDVEIISYEIVNDDLRGISAQKVIDKLKNIDFDLLVICIAGWIPSWAVIKITAVFSHKPMLLWGLSGYFKDNTLHTTADQAGTSALRSVFEDMGYNFKYIYNTPRKGTDMQKLACFIKACRALEMLKKSKIGMMGYRDMSLFGTLYDATSLKCRFGIEVEHFEMLEIVKNIEKIKDKEVKAVLEKIKSKWVFSSAIKDSTILRGIEFYLAIKEKIHEKDFDAISLIDVDGMKKLEGFPPAIIFMLIADELNICTIPENDTMGSVTQLFSKYLTGQVSAYLEFYEFMEDRVLMGVPDFVPSGIVEGSTVVMPTKFGDFDEGILNISKLRTGKVTLGRIASKGPDYKMHMLTGEAVIPSKWEEVGWAPPAPQLPGLEIILDNPVDTFAQKVLSQHYIITYGDNTDLFRELCLLLNIKIV